MFDEFAFRDLVRRKGKTMKQVAEALGISTTTLYRKMSGESDFYRGEIQTMCRFLGEESLGNIFFAKNVS